MTSPERDILQRLLARLDLLQISVEEDLSLLRGVPKDRREFDTMPVERRSASRAVLKSFEQIEDQLARSFRAIPGLVGQDTRQWFARDYADYMERIGILESAARWSAIVKLRNELVHDYPIDPDIQFQRFRQAVAALPDLAAARERLAHFVKDELPDHKL